MRKDEGRRKRGKSGRREAFATDVRNNGRRGKGNVMTTRVRMRRM